MMHPNKPFAREKNTKLEAHLFASYKGNIQVSTSNSLKFIHK
jgi:hypothetical protein